MSKNKKNAECIIAVFDKQGGIYTFSNLQAVDSSGNIISGPDTGMNINTFDEITTLDPSESLENIDHMDGVLVSVKKKTGSTKAFYRVKVKNLNASFNGGKFESNFIDSDKLLEVSEKYRKYPNDLYTKNNLYMLLYFRMLYILANGLHDIAINDSLATHYDADDLDSVLIHKLAECTDYLRPSSFNNILNSIFRFLDTKLETKPLVITGSENQVNHLDFIHDKKEISEIIDIVSKKFVGQEKAVKELALNIYYNVNIISRLNPDVAARNKASILLDGSTGTGKTAILKEFSTLMDVPIVVADATEFSTVGYHGPDLTDILVGLLDNAQGNLDRAQKGVVFLDEFDKLAFNDDTSGELVFKKGIQDELLKYIEGGVFNITYNHRRISFDTSKVTFVCGGAFTKLRDAKIRDNNKSKRPIGFSTNLDSPDENNTYELTSKDFIDFGIQRELIGRLKTKIHTKTYTKEDLLTILRDSTISPLKEFVDIINSSVSYAPTIFISDEFVESIADMAFELGTGVRGLQEIMEGVRTLLLEDLLIIKPEQISLTTDLLNKVEEKKVRSY